MKKILVVFSSYHYSDAVLKWLVRMNDQTPILATGIFLPASAFASIFSYAAAANASGETGYFPAPDKDEKEEISSQMQQFEKDCLANGISFRLHPGRMNLTMPDISVESRFSDLMLISGESFFIREKGEDRTAHIHDLAKAAECPLLIIPEHFIFPSSVILAYDGSPNSVFAIRQFAYILREFTVLPTLLMNAGQNDPGHDIPFKDEAIELITSHFNDLTLQKIDLDPGKFFGEWIDNRKGSILVSGSLGRSKLSQLFNKSFIEDVILAHHIPVFTAQAGN
jgi:hypothetical protein